MSLQTYSVKFSTPNEYGGNDTQERIIYTRDQNSAIEYVKKTMLNPENFHNYRAELIVCANTSKP